MAAQLSITEFAWKNLWRRRLRTVLTLLGIAMGIGAFVALVGLSGAFETAWLRFYQSTGTDVSVIGANLLNSSMDESLAANIRALPDVAAVAPLAFNLVDLTPDISGIVYGWTDDSYEFDSLTLLSGRRFRPGQPEVLLGELLADDLKKKSGDTLSIEGSTFTVAGVFRGGSALEDGAVIMPIRQLEVISNQEGRVFAFHVRLRPTPAGLKRDEYLEHAASEIEAAVPGSRAEPAAERSASNQFVRLAHSVAWGTSFIAVTIGMLGIANTMAMSVFERTREIGVLRALGWKGGHVILLILTEATVLGVTGGLLGIAMGWGGLRILAVLPQTSSILPASVSPLHLLEALLIAIAAGLVAGVYPAWRGARFSPVEALRYE